MCNRIVHGLIALTLEACMIDFNFWTIAIFSKSKKKTDRTIKKTTISSHVFIAFLQKWVKVSAWDFIILNIIQIDHLKFQLHLADMNQKRTYLSKCNGLWTNCEEILWKKPKRTILKKRFIVFFIPTTPGHAKTTFWTNLSVKLDKLVFSKNKSWQVQKVSFKC